MLLLLLIGLSLQFQQQWATSLPEVPCFFIFGDDTVDNGNNNNLTTVEKANYLPYGIGFPQGPTGRFTDGLTIVDFIARFLGLNFIPPYATASEAEILKGVNYASSSAGLFSITSYTKGDRIGIDQQQINHQRIIRKIEGKLGKAGTQKLLNKCIYSISIGSNDYTNNYFIPEDYISNLRNPQDFAANIVNRYAVNLKTLYAQGARKVAVFGLGYLGCSPAVIKMFPTYGRPCVDKINEASALFNDKLKPLLAQLNSNLTGANFTYIGVFRSSSSRLGALDSRGTCCETEESTGLCRRNGTVCPARNGKVYWDGYRTTEAANRVYATFAYNAQTPADAHPYDINQLT